MRTYNLPLGKRRFPRGKLLVGGRMTFAGKRMGPGGFRGLQIRWAGLSRVGRRVRFPCASATRTWLAGAYAIGFFRSEGRG